VSPPGGSLTHCDFDKLSNHLSLFQTPSDGSVSAAGSAFSSKTPPKSRLDKRKKRRRTDPSSNLLTQTDIEELVERMYFQKHGWNILMVVPKS
jgi:hypothetical protein